MKAKMADGTVIEETVIEETKVEAPKVIATTPTIAQQAQAAAPVVQNSSWGWREYLLLGTAIVAGGLAVKTAYDFANQDSSVA